MQGHVPDHGHYISSKRASTAFPSTWQRWFRSLLRLVFYRSLLVKIPPRSCYIKGLPEKVGVDVGMLNELNRLHDQSSSLKGEKRGKVFRTITRVLARQNQDRINTVSSWNTTFFYKDRPPFRNNERTNTAIDHPGDARTCWRKYTASFLDFKVHEREPCSPHLREE